jgi:hypothetical protein
VEEDLVEASHLMRKEVNQAFSEGDPKTGDKVMQIWKGLKKCCMARDEQFVVEDAILNTLAGDGSEKRLCDHMLALFPTANNHKSVADTFHQLNKLPGTDAFKFATNPAQIKHGLIVKMLGKLYDDRAPALIALNQDPNLKRIVDSLPHFLEEFETGGSTDLHVRHAGVVVLKRELERAAREHVGGNLQPLHVHKLRAFMHLIPAENVVEAREMVAQADKEVAVVMSEKTGASSDKKKKKE